MMVGQVPVALPRAREVEVKATARGAHVRARASHQPGPPNPVERCESVPGWAVPVDVQDIRTGRPGGDGQVPGGAAAELCGDPLRVGGGVTVAVPGCRDLLVWLAGKHRPAARSVGQGLDERVIGHDAVRTRMLPGPACPHPVVSVMNCADRAGRIRVWYSAWADSSPALRRSWR